MSLREELEADDVSRQSMALLRVSHAHVPSVNASQQHARMLTLGMQLHVLDLLPLMPKLELTQPVLKQPSSPHLAQHD